MWIRTDAEPCTARFLCITWDAVVDHRVLAHKITEIVTLLFTRGLVYVAGIIGIAALFCRRSQRIGLSKHLTLPVAAAAGAGMIIGARLYSLMEAGGLLTGDPARWIGRHGVGSWGACIGAALGATAYLWFDRSHLLAVLDAGASCTGLAVGTARIGCLLAGCDFGRVTSLTWAIHYPAGSPAFNAHVVSGLIMPDSAQSLSVHPLPVYLSLNALVLFVILSAIWRRTRYRPGITFASAWILYGITRFFWEFLRDPAAGGAVTGIALSQKMALVSIGIGIAIAVGVSRRFAHPAPMSASQAAA